MDGWMGIQKVEVGSVCREGDGGMVYYNMNMGRQDQDGSIAGGSWCCAIQIQTQRIHGGKGSGISSEMQD